MSDIRRDGDFKKEEREYTSIRKFADHFFLHIAGYLLSKGMKPASVISWDEEIRRPHSEPEKRYVGKILLPNQVSHTDDLLIDPYLRERNISIKRGANSSGGIDPKTKKYTFNVENTNGNYRDLRDLTVALEKMGAIPVNDEILNYVVLVLKDPATKMHLLMEAGKIPKYKPLILERIFQPKIIKPKVYVLA